MSTQSSEKTRQTYLPAVFTSLSLMGRVMLWKWVLFWDAATKESSELASCRSKNASRGERKGSLWKRAGSSLQVCWGFSERPSVLLKAGQATPGGGYYLVGVALGINLTWSLCSRQGQTLPGSESLVVFYKFSFLQGPTVWSGRLRVKTTLPS